MKRNIIKTMLATVVLAATALGASAQDLIARQAPIDRRHSAVNHVEFSHKMSSMADLNNPAADIYSDWVNKDIRKVAGHMSRGTKIDLRGFAMPTTSRKVTSNYGPRWGRRHEGLDIKVYVGDTICSAFDGKVRIVAYNARGYGYYVVIRHPNGLETLYGHMSKQLVKPDQIVKAGQPIGLGGNTGRSYGSHLHFETRVCGQPINPALMFDFENQDIVSDFYTTTQNYGSTSAVAMNAQPSRVHDARNDQATASATATETAAETRSAAPARTAVVGTSSHAKKSSASRSKSSKRGKTTAKRTTSYTVKAGDNLTAIARKNGTTVTQLRKKNGIKGNTIRQGQRLKL